MKCCIVGKFESFHRGHQTLIKEAKKECKTILIISIKRRKEGLFSEREREIIAKQLKVNLITLQFERIKDLTPKEFLQQLKQFGCKKLFAGEEWHFGKGRSGNVKTARDLGKNLGIQVKAVPIKKVNGRKVGTREIKKLLKEGKLLEANYLLGFNYFCLGIVERGSELGRKIGFPTLNVKCEKKIFLPNGVYDIIAKIGGKNFKGIANFGRRPTVNTSSKRTLEVHIPDSQLPELYGREIKVEFLQFLRTERKFNSVKELQNQIKFDVENLKSYWRKKVEGRQ